jgi:hypothetical protein
MTLGFSTKIKWVHLLDKMGISLVETFGFRNGKKNVSQLSVFV